MKLEKQEIELQNFSEIQYNLKCRFSRKILFIVDMRKTFMKGVHLDFWLLLAFLHLSVINISGPVFSYLLSVLTIICVHFCHCPIPDMRRV